MNSCPLIEAIALSIEIIFGKRKITAEELELTNDATKRRRIAVVEENTQPTVEERCQQVLDVIETKQVRCVGNVLCEKRLTKDSHFTHTYKLHKNEKQRTIRELVFGLSKFKEPSFHLTQTLYVIGKEELLVDKNMYRS